jgi:conjugative transfer signal peptidase TraF
MTFRRDPRFPRQFGVLCASGIFFALGTMLILNNLQRWGFYRNLTSSLPEGLYQVVQPGQSNIIVFCPSGFASNFSIERGYRLEGNCPDQHAPLLKPIVAQAGDIVRVQPTGIYVNGKRLPKSQQYTIDSLHRPLPRYPSGTYTVQQGTAWVISSYSSTSFDSRYYGPINLSEVVNYVKPYVTY